MADMHTIRRNTFMVGFAIEGVFLILAVLFKQQFVMDCIFSLAAIGLFYLIEQRYPLNPVVIVLGMMPLFIHSAGVVLGFFSFTILGLGYDKWSHFTNSLLVTIVIFYILIAYSRDDVIKKVIVAGFVMLGINTLQETLEFIGTRYLGILNESLFSQGDRLPIDLKNDFQVFDTWWDMIFDIFGVIAASIIIGIILWLEKHHYKRWLMRNI
ncbi:TPA: hypothetical protein HA235_00060 [Candidatus Woesearchaeota archaeon]|nr:hypothetical protein [Candidatus Woesearchaeota archaeon]HIH31078.1 hypothetical protein [Candidatus Woesearchaeota archaeon]HIH55294.1 hypothetical protein [Candidatus Woesearchaeota archaeon]HIJ01537.1 hypothetical protein [Candidatus Woesearchaeota archaeon]HIJ13841.1 hypothetical protein [Candidatus Woesearchaeota archaeon]